jgi:hypothetical protein
MTTRTYFRFGNSNDTRIKWFRVPVGQIRRLTSKRQTADETLDGSPDNQEGKHVVMWQITVRVRGVASGADPEGVNWATLDDLRYFFGLKNPRATPSTRIKMWSHTSTGDGDFVWGRLLGDLDESAFTPMMDGNESWYYTTIAFKEE